MKQLVLTLIGQDRPGLVEEVSSTVLLHNGNWLASNLSHLAGHFAGILQVEVPEDKLLALQEALHNINNLEVKIEDGEQTAHCPDKQLNLVITGNDRPGIVQELSSVIRHKGASIIHFTSKQQSAPNWGVPLFNAIATVHLPEGLDKNEVINALESITTDVIVDVEPA
ncbi:glycine cleavage system protein R [Pseudoalteromonas denitrificans]|jgi:glycine cleavage system regulatory protein|uniref:Glycine cleavage system transcriptional repressor n=1 Tax=Pseudoalteromonas denitrificans DSM 6059 TaxID=1123010 RepID=A0A1I1E2D8_9GAMM|nr:ACT domain-containing protein [Pseudoalteromonas denitrificans]SFB81375.1 Glycine cleavage system regulatory protein [Pseudoalteromonas denitrificans DSM 6059]